MISSTLVSEIERGRLTPWVHTALRTRSPEIREIFARALSDGRLGAAELRDHVAAGEPLGRPAGRVAAALGTIWAASPTAAADMLAGQRLLRGVVEHDPSVLTRAQQQVFAQVSFVIREFADVEYALAQLLSIPTVVAASLRTDLLNPAGAGHGERDEWLARLTAPFIEDGLAPITVEPGRETLFDGLSSTAAGQVDGPLVTVIVPCYQPDAALATSIASLRAQSYENLEVILVDDASGPEYHHYFEQAGAMDPRIRLLRMPQNGGTYRGRNAALQEAGGDYVTVQDADDWSHPERIAAQVCLLASSPAAGGSSSDAIRATDDLLHQWIGYSPRRRNASSLMFRRGDLERTGPFDLVRKSGDSEFHERLTTLIGPIVDTRTPLAVTRLRGGSLSRADFAYQWMTPDRLLYRAAYRSWHRTLTDSPPGAAPAVGGAQRAFPAPTAMLRGLPGDDEHGAVDLLVIADLSDPAAEQAILELSALPARVGVLQLEDPTRGRRRRPEPAEAVMACARRGALTLISATEQVRATVTIVLTAGTLTLLPDPAPRLRTDRAVVVARPPRSAATLQDLTTVSDGCLRILGSRPEWAALSADEQAEWSADGWDLPLAATLVHGGGEPRLGARG